jgi:hypothetical protein
MVILVDLCIALRKLVHPQFDAVGELRQERKQAYTGGDDIGKEFIPH